MEKYLTKKIEVNTILCAVCGSKEVIGVPYTNTNTKKEMILLLCKSCNNIEIMEMAEYQKEMQKVD